MWLKLLPTRHSLALVMGQSLQCSLVKANSQSLPPIVLSQMKKLSMCHFSSWPNLLSLCSRAHIVRWCAESNCPLKITKDREFITLMKASCPGTRRVFAESCKVWLKQQTWCSNTKELAMSVRAPLCVLFDVALLTFMARICRYYKFKSIMVDHKLTWSWSPNVLSIIWNAFTNTKLVWDSGTSMISNKKVNIVTFYSRCTVQAMKAWWLVNVHASVTKWTQPEWSWRSFMICLWHFR